MMDKKELTLRSKDEHIKYEKYKVYVFVISNIIYYKEEIILVLNEC